MPRLVSARFAGVLCRASLVFALGASFGLVDAFALEINRVAAQTDTERARAEFARGVEAYGRSEFQAALDAFQEAYRLAPHPAVRVNIANCYEQLGRPLEALHHFENFLSETESPSRAQRREVQAAIARLSARVGQLELHVSPDGALVTVDGSTTRRAPVTDTIRVEQGRHTVQVTMDGYVTTERAVEVPGGGRARVDVRLDRPVVASASSPGTTEGGTTTSETSGGSTAGGGTTEGGAGSQSSETSAATATTGSGDVRVVGSDRDPGQTTDGGGDFRITTPVWIAGGATIALGIGAAITGILALSANDDFEYNVGIAQDPSSTPGEIAIARQDGQSAADSARTLALVSDVLLITTIIGAGATTFFLITTQEGGLLGDMASEQGPTFMATPLIAPGLAGVGVSGSF